MVKDADTGVFKLPYDFGRDIPRIKSWCMTCLFLFDVCGITVLDSCAADHSIGASVEIKMGDG